MTAVKKIFIKKKNLWIRLDELCKQMESIFLEISNSFSNNYWPKTEKYSNE